MDWDELSRDDCEDRPTNNILPDRGLKAAGVGPGASALDIGREGDRAVIFDMNGVLVDDEELHQLAFRRVLNDVGVVLDQELYATYFAGRTDREGMLAFLKAKAADFAHRVDSLVKRKSLIYQRLARNGLRPYPGAARLVKRLHDAGYRLAVATGSYRREADSVLSTLRLREMFDVVITADDVTNGKPAPEVFLVAARRLGVSPRHCVVVEDSPYGVAAAKAAGMACVAVSSTHAQRDLQGANLVVRSLTLLSPSKLGALGGASSHNRA